MEEAIAQDWAFTQTATDNLDLWTTALRPVSVAEMEEQQAHAQKTGLLISKRILERSHMITKEDTEDSGPVQSVLVKSFEQAQQQCYTTWTEVTNWLTEILEHHIPCCPVSSDVYPAAGDHIDGDGLGQITGTLVH